METRRLSEIVGNDFWKVFRSCEPQKETFLGYAKGTEEEVSDYFEKTYNPNGNAPLRVCNLMSSLDCDVIDLSNNE